VVRRKGVARTAHRVVPLAGAAVTIAVLIAASPVAKIVGAVWLVAGIGLSARMHGASRG
jgi:hypothetical protein